MTDSIGEVLQDDRNFRLEKIDWHGKPAIKKSTKDTTPRSRVERIQNDVRGMKFFAKLAAANPKLEIYVPEVYDSGPNFYIREYIESEPLLEKSAGIDEAKARLEILVRLLADIDRLEPGPEVGYVGSSNYRNLERSIPRWADENLRDKLITEEQAGRVKLISAGLGEYLQPRIAHGDMTAYKHSFLRPDGKVAFIDFENFTSGAARYFDVAWSYVRLYSFAVSTEIPKMFLADFLARAEKPEHQTEQLMAALIQRTLGMQKDADYDLKAGGTDFRARANELLELVLQNKLEILHS